MKLSKLLLPLDFSEKSAAAAAYARALACRFQSELTIAHVFELSRIFMPMPEGGTSAEWYEDRKNHAKRELHEFGADLFAGMPVESVLLEGGDTARAIVDLAHSRQIDLIVMPTHGYGVFRRFMLGSVTAKVLHDADCPVWTGVHLADSTMPGPIQFQKILCAIDFDSTGEKALRWAADFAAKYDAGLTLVHALPWIGPTELEYSDQALPAVMKQAAADHAQQLQARVGTSANCILETGGVSSVVRDAAAAGKFDLVVIGRHENQGALGRLRGNAYAIVRESPCPVVSI